MAYGSAPPMKAPPKRKPTPGANKLSPATADRNSKNIRRRDTPRNIWRR